MQLNLEELNKKYSIMDEIYLSEEKCKQNNIDINKAYAFLDDYFAKHHIDRICQGVWCGDFDNTEHWTTFMALAYHLPNTTWFLKVVDKWYTYENDLTEENKEDCLAVIDEVERRAKR